MPANPAKKIFNDPLKCADELLDGLVLAYDGKARKVGQRSIVMNDLRPNAPALLVGGGAGHEPIYHGHICGVHVGRTAAGRPNWYGEDDADTIFEANSPHASPDNEAR